VKTVSLDMARKLSEAGYPQTLRLYDSYYYYAPFENKYLPKPVVFDFGVCSLDERDLKAPYLPDLLEWLEGRGYRWSLMLTPWGEYLLELFRDDREFYNGFHADTPTDTIGEAVLWVPQQEKKTYSLGDMVRSGEMSIEDASKLHKTFAEKEAKHDDEANTAK